MRFMNKKGAIEMSMQTIIIVVIGVTLLVLGLNFVRNIMGEEGIGGMGSQMSELSDKQMSDLFGESEEPIYLPRDEITLKQGDTDAVDVNIRNTDYDAGIFKYAVVPDDTGNPSKVTVNTWFRWKTTGRQLENGKGYKEKLVIEVPDNARTGTYFFDLNLDCGSTKDCAFAQLIIEVE